MVSVRGVNVFPTAVEAVVREFSEIAEYRAVVSHRSTQPSLTMEIEVVAAENAEEAETTAMRLARQLRQSFGLTVPVAVVRPGTLPRFEVKARRFVIER